jgi:hypothetical protein
MSKLPSIALAAWIATLLSVGIPNAQAKQQCSAAAPSNPHGQWWSYRLIDGRKCWYEGKPMLSKSLLHWPAAQTAQTNPRREPKVLPASQDKLLDARASVSDDPDAKPKPEIKPEVADGSSARTPKQTLTPNDLRAWGNSMAAMTAEPVLTILDRWPDAELSQHRTEPAPVEQQSAMNTRAFMMVTIVFMALLAVLMTVYKKAGGASNLDHEKAETKLGQGAMGDFVPRRSSKAAG